MLEVLGREAGKGGGIERVSGGTEGERVVGVGHRRAGTETRAERALRIVRVRVLEKRINSREGN